VLTKYHAHEIVTITERHLRNGLKFGTAGEVDSKEGVAPVEGLELAPTNISEVVTPQGEIDGAVGEALITQPPPQRARTKLFFDVRIDNPFLD